MAVSGLKKALALSLLAGPLFAMSARAAAPSTALAAESAQPAGAQTGTTASGAGAAGSAANAASEGGIVTGVSTAGINPAKLVLLKELIGLLAPGKNAERALQASFAEQERTSMMVLEQIISTRAPKDATAADIAKMKELVGGRQLKIIKRTQELFRQQIDLDALCNSIYCVVYDKYFDESQLKDLVTFYKSPAGQRFRDVQQDILGEAMAMTSKAIDGKIIPIMRQVEAEVGPPPGAKPAAEVPTK